MFLKDYHLRVQHKQYGKYTIQTIADYFQLVTEYAILTKNLDHFQQYFENIFHFAHPNSSKFTDCTTTTELVPGLEKEEARLNDECKKLTDIFEAIQISMR